MSLAEQLRLIDRLLAEKRESGFRQIQQQIDEIVFDLYRLTDAERQLIIRQYEDTGTEWPPMEQIKGNFDGVDCLVYYDWLSSPRDVAGLIFRAFLQKKIESILIVYEDVEDKGFDEKVAPLIAKLHKYSRQFEDVDIKAIGFDSNDYQEMRGKFNSSNEGLYRS